MVNETERGEKSKWKKRESMGGRGVRGYIVPSGKKTEIIHLPVWNAESSPQIAVCARVVFRGRSSRPGEGARPKKGERGGCRGGGRPLGGRHHVINRHGRTRSTS